MKVNLVIIGGGPGGYETAIYAAKHNIETVLIEAKELGGVCLNEGCIPTKALVHASKTYAALPNLASYGIKVNGASFDMTAFQQEKLHIINDFRLGVSQLLELNKVRLIKGFGKLVDAHHVAVNDEVITTDYIILACGSSQTIVDFKVPTLTSHDMLEATEIKDSLAIIGGGSIGLEFASIYANLGVAVTVIEKMPQILPGMDEGMVKALRVLLKKKNVNFYTGQAVKSIELVEHTYNLHLEDDTVISARHVLQCIGRHPNTEGLGLSAVDIFHDRKGVKVDEHCRTNVANIFAVGDLNGRQMIATAASMQGQIAVDAILGKNELPLSNLTPKVVFTDPVFAQIGASEEELKAQQTPYQAYKSYFAVNGYARATGATAGSIKILANSKGQILGCSILGEEAQELIQEMQLVMIAGLNLNNLKEIIRVHPSLSEIIGACLK